MGFPIQRSPDLGLFSGSPKLIAAYHVFHRLLTPRHPPYALSSLTINFILLKLMPSSLHPYSIVKEQIKNSNYIFHTGWEKLFRPLPHLILVEMSGFEPPTPCVQGRCSPAELHPHLNFGFRIVDCGLIINSAFRNPQSKMEWWA
jgi:hypothetical protein